jgi:hypothetical protein
MLTWMIAATLLPLLLYLPGWALLRAIAPPSNDQIERHYERVVVGALWHGWLALVLASLGGFSLLLQIALTLLVSGVAFLLSRRRSLPPTAPSAHEPTTPTPRWETFAWALVLGVALMLTARPFEVVLGVRDAGVYANAGFAIASTGSLVQHDAVLAGIGQDALSPDASIADPARQALSNFLISQPRDRYIATRLRAAGFFVNEGMAPSGQVIPQGLHLLPAWIGLLTALGGPYFGLWAPGLLGLLGVWSVGMLGRRLAGAWVGLLAALLLALNGVQIWFARYSTAETLAQFLIWMGLYFFAKMQQSKGHDLPTARYTAVLAGIAIGQVALARIDFFLLGPVLLYLLYCWVARRWHTPQTALALGLGLMLAHAGLHIATIARAYFFDTGHDRLREYALVALFSLPFLTPELQTKFLSAPGSGLARPLRLWLELAALAVAVGGVLLVRWRSGWLHQIEHWLSARRTGLLNAVFVGIMLIGGYAYFVRPAILDADLLFNTRGGWSDPLTRDPELVARDVREGRMTVDEARLGAGVVLQPDQPFWFAVPDQAATAELRTRLAAERGDWAGPFSNQTHNWLRLQGYVGAPIRLPVELWYNEYSQMSWWERRTTDPATIPSEPAPVNDKYKIPLANLVRVGWYLSPLGVILGLIGYALWWRRGLSAASWLFLVVAFLGTFFFVRQTYGTSEQTYIYILRRFVPIAYPAFSLGCAYALVALAHPLRAPRIALLRPLLATSLAGLLVLFFAVTNRPIYTHVEYRGALAQLEQAASQFSAENDIVLLRGGGPIHAVARDVPDLAATPLRFNNAIDMFTVKSTAPGQYADDLAQVVARWQASGRNVYLALSASGGSFALPGYRLEPAGQFRLDLPEFEALTSQKPRNVAQLTLDFNVYKLVPATPASIGTTPLPFGPQAVAAQVQGFYRAERSADGQVYSWTNGVALLRLEWPADAAPRTLMLTLAAGERPAHLGAAEVCLSARPEAPIWPTTNAPEVDLGCVSVNETAQTYPINLDPALLPAAPSGTLLLELRGPAWVPAAEDQRQSDQRAVHVQFYGLE